MGERRAFWCDRCEPPVRVFLQAGEKIPACKHGVLKLQPNQRYFGRPTGVKVTGRGKA